MVCAFHHRGKFGRFDRGGLGGNAHTYSHKGNQQAHMHLDTLDHDYPRHDTNNTAGSIHRNVFRGKFSTPPG